MNRRSFLRAAGALAVAGAVPLHGFTQTRGTLHRLRFNLGWRNEATAAGFLLALQRGYYREEGLDVTIDTGNGSAAAIGLVASGAYDCVTADLATMIEFNVNNPDNQLKAMAIQYDLNPNSVLVRRDGPIQKPADFVGRQIIGQHFNASRKLFPVFAKHQGFDPSTVQWQNLAPEVADPLFVRGEFDGAAYFYFSGVFNMKLRGMDPERLRVFRFSDYGMQSYGNGLVANAKSMENAEAMAAFVRASTRGWIEAIADPKAGAAAVKAREALVDEELELERLKLVAEGSMVTENTLRDGWGAATAERLQATIDETTDAFGLSRRLSVDEIWTPRFLPSAELRKLKV